MEIVESHHDLQVISNSHSKEHVANTLQDRLTPYCQTSLGKCWIYHWLIHPTSDRTVLEQRRKTIEYFEQKVEEIWKPDSTLESKISWFFEEIPSEVQVLLSKVYLHFQWFPSIAHYWNQSILYHKVIQSYKMYLNPVFQIVLPLLVFGLSLFASFWMISKTGIRNTFHFWKQCLAFFWRNTQSKSKITMILTIGFYLFSFFYNIYQSFQEIIFMQTVYQQLYETIHPILGMYHAMKTWYERIPNEFIPEKFQKTVPKIIEWFPTCVSSCFLDSEYQPTNSESFFQQWMTYPRSEIAVTFYRLSQQKESFSTMFAFMGWVDAMQNLAQMRKENGEMITWSNYRTDEKKKRPWICSKAMYYPLLLDKEKNRSNPVDISEKEFYHRIITGPNAAGKSTYLKSVGLNQHLAQTIGFVFAKDYECSLFEQFHSQLQLQDLKGSYSLFEAEMLRCQIFLEKIQNKKLSLCLFDELFSSTNVHEGFAAAFAFVEHCLKKDHISFLMTTHFGLLKVLEKKGCKMVRFDIQRKDGQIHYPYQLKKGISKQWIALELLANQPMSKEWIHRAQSMIPLLMKLDRKHAKELQKWVESNEGDGSA